MNMYADQRGTTLDVDTCIKDVYNDSLKSKTATSDDAQNTQQCNHGSVVE